MRGLRIAAAVLLGTVSVTVGFGIGVWPAIRLGFSFGHLLGFAAFLAGLALLFWATGSVVRPLRWYWRLLAVPVWLFAIYWVLMPLALAMAVTHGPRMPVGARTPADEGLAYEEVTFPAEDGVRIAAWYIPSDGRAGIVVVPGSLSSRSAALKHASVLAKEGYGVLLIDPRGQGRSAGTAMDWGWYTDRDISGAVTFLATQDGVDPERIGALGLSMGGEAVLTAAAKDPRIRAVVAEGATVRCYEDVRPVLRGAEVFFGVPHYGVQFAAADLLTPAAPPMPLAEAASRVAPRPALLICTDAEAPYNERMRDAAPVATELWAGASTRHIAAVREDAEQWEKRVLAVFRKL